MLESWLRKLLMRRQWAPHTKTILQDEDSISFPSLFFFRTGMEVTFLLAPTSALSILKWHFNSFGCLFMDSSDSDSGKALMSTRSSRWRKNSPEMRSGRRTNWIWTEKKKKRERKTREPWENWFSIVFLLTRRHFSYQRKLFSHTLATSS